MRKFGRIRFALGENLGKTGAARYPARLSSGPRLELPENIVFFRLFFGNPSKHWGSRIQFLHKNVDHPHIAMKRFVTPRQVLPVFFRDRRWDAAWAIQELRRAWPGLVGAKLARVSAPAVLRNGRLWVYVANALWAQELSFRQGGLLGRLRARLPGQELFGVRAVVEPSWFAAPPENATARRAAEPSPPPPATFAAIDDAACREALIRLWRATRAGGAGTGMGAESPPAGSFGYTPRPRGG